RSWTGGGVRHVLGRDRRGGVVGPAAQAAEPGPALLVAVDAQDMGTFDRVTFTFRSAPTDAIPMIRRAEYVDRPVLEDASGKEIEVTGNAILRIAMSPAATAA